MRKETVEIYCDLIHQRPMDAKPEEFKLLGYTYRVDLCPTHRDKLYDFLAPYTAVSTITGPDKAAPSRLKKRVRPVAERHAAKVVRAWWADHPDVHPADPHGIGRIPAQVHEAYKNRNAW